MYLCHKCLLIKQDLGLAWCAARRRSHLPRMVELLMLLNAASCVSNRTCPNFHHLFFPNLEHTHYPAIHLYHLCHCNSHQHTCSDRLLHECCPSGMHGHVCRAAGQQEYWDVFQDAYRAVMQHYRSGPWYDDADIGNGRSLHQQFQSLQAFWPGPPEPHAVLRFAALC